MKTTKSKYTQPKLNTLPLGFQPIQVACETFAGERRLLSGVVSKFNSQVAALREGIMPTLNLRANFAARAARDLHELIDANRPLFDKPRTRVFSDIKVGLQKQKGSTDFEDEEKTIALIEKHLPDRLDELAPATRRVSKSALAHLTAAELKKIGVEITADTDAVLIKPQDSDVEKAVAALLAESTQPQLDKAA